MAGPASGGERDCAENGVTEKTAVVNGEETGTPPRRATVKPLSPQRYRVQFTIGQESYDQLRQLQALLRREVAEGGVGLVFERALNVLHGQVTKAKLGRVSRAPRLTAKQMAGTSGGRAMTAPASGRPVDIRRAADDRARSRHIRNDVRRAVWWRDRAQCAFVSASGHRCTERSFLELHHIQPYALQGPAVAANISLRCRRHNQYEAELVFGADVGQRRNGRGPAAKRHE